MLSILIPTYNTPIGDLVREIQNQITPLEIPYEIRVWEDGSTIHENENSQIDQNQNCYYHTNKQNQGRTFTRNQLAEKAKFDYLLFLDADVFPSQKSFIATYLQQLPKVDEILFGGYAYTATKNSTTSLRWTYGHKREYAPITKRNIQPYHYVFSGNYLLHKKTFQKLDIPLSNQYGMDLLWAQDMQNKQIKAVQIDNTIYHLGLELNRVFLEKSLQAVTLRFTHRKTLNTPYEKTYQRIKKMHAQHLIAFLFKPLKPLIKCNLLSKNPNMLAFDCYRMFHYLQMHLKEHVSDQD